MPHVSDPVPAGTEERRREIVRLFASAVVRLSRRSGAFPENSEKLSDSGRRGLELPACSATHVAVR